MPKFSRFVAFILLVGMMSLAGSAFAQESEVPCLDLSEADCDLYRELIESAEFPLSAAFEFEIDGSATGGEIPPGMEFNMLATGAYVFESDTALAAIETFAALSVLDVDLRSILDVTDGVFSSFDAELNVAVTLPPDMGGSAFGPFDFWLVDGAAYMDMTPVGALSGDTTMAGVMGVDVFDFIEVPLSEVRLGDLFERLDSMEDDFEPSDFNMTDGENPFEDFQNYFAQFANPITEEDLAGIATMERLPDETIGNSNVVVFQTTIDVARIFEVEAIRNQVAAQWELQNLELPEDMDVDQLFTIIGKALNGSTIVVVEKIDSESGLGLVTNFTMDLTLDPEPLNEIEPTGMTEAIDMDFAMNWTWSEINNVEAIELPADAQLIPVETLMGDF
jgi:hypothetical protein